MVGEGEGRSTEEGGEREGKVWGEKGRRKGSGMGRIWKEGEKGGRKGKGKKVPPIFQTKFTPMPMSCVHVKISPYRLWVISEIDASFNMILSILFSCCYLSVNRLIVLGPESV